MRTLQHTLQDQDPGFLRIIAELWGLDIPSGSPREALQRLAQQMLQTETLSEIILALPAQASRALSTLIQQGGKSPWYTWERQFGTVRAMGPGRRDRQQPWRSPTSASEMLWYRGLLGRAFLDTPKGPQEYAYLPADVYQQLQHPTDMASIPTLVPTEPPARREEAAATILDDCTTLLAALRRQTRPSADPLISLRPILQPHLIHAESLGLSLVLMQSGGLIRKGNRQAELTEVRDFLLADRMLSLRQLYQAWKSSTRWNDLAALPHLQKRRGAWPNDPTLARKTLLGWLAKLEPGKWYSISDLIRAVYEEDSAFQRTGGDFSSWYLRDVEGVPLDGIEHWYAVEGALLRSLLKGPLRWFGALQLGTEADAGHPSHFSPTRLLGLLEDPQAFLPAVAETGQATVRADGLVTIPRLAPRSLRYQLARFLDWERHQAQQYHYRLSIRALQEAQRQGLQLHQVRSILTQASESELPPSMAQAIDRYEQQGYRAAIADQRLLRVIDPTILSTLCSHPSTRRYLGEVLNETTACVNAREWERLVRAAARLGILIDGPDREPPH